MRIEAQAISISWIPSESVHGALKGGFDLGVAHYDAPPPDVVESVEQVRSLRDSDAFRFANVLSGWVDVEDGRILAAGLNPEAGIVIGSTTVRVAKVGATFRAVTLPDMQPEPVIGEGSVLFRQTVGGRTGVPLPRPVPHPPFVQWQAPIVWTTLELTVLADGQTKVELAGASAFPRHWVYGTDGKLALKSGVTDQKTWVAHSFGDRTPWGEQDSPALVTAAETELERQMSSQIMKAGKRPDVRRLPEGSFVTKQGEPGDELFLLLDGVLGVEVDGERVAQVGPGAILGERAVLEGGRRTSTLVAITPVRLAAAKADIIDIRRLQDLAQQHQREG
ncbi:MAG TPA: cyclic nucleotide-binding domain-containing protein [Actinomycetes bacterium]|nr:cyclic nucleotide-binding domain-containing protein [Actinomycetes bacterium]